MEEYLTKEELNETTGGGKLSFGIAFAIGGVLTFLLGVVNGWQRPYPCNYSGR